MDVQQAILLLNLLTTVYNKAGLKEVLRNAALSSETKVDDIVCDIFDLILRDENGE